MQLHKKLGTLATLKAMQPESRYGVLRFEENLIIRFREKPTDAASWANGGFFVLSPRVIDYIDSDETFFEQEPMKQLTSEGRLSAMSHHGFWQCVDTLCDKQYLRGIMGFWQGSVEELVGTQADADRGHMTTCLTQDIAGPPSG